MKTLLLASLFFLTLSISKAQFAIEELDINNVKATVLSVGPLFNDLTNAKYVVPRPTGGQLEKSTIYGTAPWIGGVANGQLHLAAETYRQNGGDFQCGPISTDTSELYRNYWIRLWKINKIELDTFILRVQHGDDVSSFHSILNWPAKGNMPLNDLSINNYAPFVDTDSNGLYDPNSGDYPLIKGDQCIYSIMNDRMPHTESLGQPLEIDVHRMVYAYATNDALNNTVFVDYKIVNRSDRTYEPFVFSSWVDFDLGNYIDDYVGTDSSRNMVYGFNGDNNDQGISGYGLNPPAQACVFLNRKMNTSMYYNNDFNINTGNPSSPADYYNYISGKWKDGASKTAAGNGYNTSGPVTPFSYSGDPCNNTGWWEGSAGITPGDRRILASTESVTFSPNDELNISLAFVYARDTSNIASVCALKGAVDYVVSWYNNPTRTGILETEHSVAFSVFPNPAKTSISIEGVKDPLATVSVFDITGKLHKLHSMADGNTIIIDDLNTGLYLVTVTTENGSSTKKLLIE